MALNAVAEVETGVLASFVPAQRTSKEKIDGAASDDTFVVSLVDHTQDPVLRVLALRELRVDNARFSRVDGRGRRVLRPTKSTFYGVRLNAAGTVVEDGVVSLIQYDPDAWVADQLPAIEEGVLHVVPQWMLLVYVELRRRPDVVFVTESGRLARVVMKAPEPTDRELSLEYLLTWERVRMMLQQDKRLTLGAAIRQELGLEEAGRLPFDFWSQMWALAGRQAPYDELYALKPACEGEPGGPLPVGPVEGLNGRKAIAVVQKAVERLMATIP